MDRHEAALRRHKRRAHNSHVLNDPSLTIRLWVLRILVPLGFHGTFFHEVRHRSHSVIADYLGLDRRYIDDNPSLYAREALSKLQCLHRDAEAQSREINFPEPLMRNVTHISELVKLSHVEQTLLAFTVLLHTDDILDTCSDMLGNLDSLKTMKVLSGVLGISFKDVQAALSPRGTLVRTGLLTLDRGLTHFRNKLYLISVRFCDHITSMEVDPVLLLSGRVNPSSKTTLTLEDYTHLQADLAVLRPYLKQALDKRRHGVNVYVYGAPGTGKTELARVLAQEFDYGLYEIAIEDDEGEPLTGETRLRAYGAAQGFFSHQRTLLLFDEVEDIFNDGESAFSKSTAQVRKGWINRMLETNPVPTIWVSNTMWLDPAFVRRFDLVIEVPVPPKQQRTRLLMQVCNDILPEKQIKNLAECQHLAPAVVTRAARVIHTIDEHLSASERARAFNRLVGTVLEAQGLAIPKQMTGNVLEAIYDPAFIQTDVNLEVVCQGLLDVKSARLCLYGPPGTGKTAFAGWLAKRLDQPLLVKRASDIFSMWVGATEKNIARAFREAEREKAVLLIDEVDSFLQDRRGASKSWEVSQVNEMLTQMESFDGVFIASTNLMDGLDQAALRRFDLKVKLDYLKPVQATQLLARVCGQLGLAAPEPASVAQIERLDVLTPGDFAAVARRHRFAPFTSVQSFVEALADECGMKEDGKRKSVGFLT